MYVIETSDGVKGTLVDAFATNADVTVSAFMNQVHDIHKEMVGSDHPEV